MTPSLPLVSIVCPAFQEELVLPIFHAQLSAALQPLERQFRFEIIFVDDGSGDRTLEVLRSLAEQDARVSFLSLSRNFGHQAALTAGLEHARGDAVISMDADLQHPPALLAELLQHWRDGYDVVITLRKEDPRLSLFKRFTSKAFYKVMHSLSDTEIRDAASDFRLLSRKALGALLQLKEQHRFVRGMVQWLGFRVKEVAFMPDERRAGQSKYTFKRMLRLAMDGLFSFSRAPLRLPIWLAGVFGLVAAGHGITALTGWLFGADASWHYLAASVHAGIASVLGSVGVVGEYVGRMHEQVKQRPVYLLKESRMQDLVPGVGMRRDAA
jgi:dolichol-phosphate mannosyltransferase